MVTLDLSSIGLYLKIVWIYWNLILILDLNWSYIQEAMMNSNDLIIDSNFMEVVRSELIQLHCENVSWERDSDKIALELVRYLLEDLVQHLSTLVFLRGNRCLFLIEWPQYLILLKHGTIC